MISRSRRKRCAEGRGSPAPQRAPQHPRQEETGGPGGPGGHWILPGTPPQPGRRGGPEETPRRCRPHRRAEPWTWCSNIGSGKTIQMSWAPGSTSSPGASGCVPGKARVRRRPHRQPGRLAAPSGRRRRGAVQRGDDARTGREATPGRTTAKSGNCSGEGRSPRGAGRAPPGGCSRAPASTEAEDAVEATPGFGAGVPGQAGEGPPPAQPPSRQGPGTGDTIARADGGPPEAWMSQNFTDPG